jgi:hypothetical protein
MGEAVVTSGDALTVMVSDFVAVTAFVSINVTVNVCVVADAPTVPLMTPVDEARVRPLGRDPVVTDHVNGAVPPAPTSV